MVNLRAEKVERFADDIPRQQVHGRGQGEVLVLSWGGTFGACATAIEHCLQQLQRAAEHQGTAFVEVYQNCVVFNDRAFQHATDREIKLDHLLELEPA